MAGDKILYDGRTFQGTDIESGNCYLEMSLLSDVLSINTIEFVVKSTDTTLLAFTRNTPLTYYHGDEKLGIFYVKSISRVGPESYRFMGTSVIGLLDEIIHYGGIYAGETADVVIADICGDIPHTVKSILKNQAIYGWLPIATARENLSQVLFAIGAAVTTDLNGVIRIESLWNGVTGSLGADRLLLGGTVTYDCAVTQISGTEHQYTKTATESETLYEGTTSTGDMITFSDPCYDLSASGFSILESGANFARVSAGTGVITGKKYTHSTRIQTAFVTTADVENVRKVEDATLVSLLNSSAVLTRLKQYYLCTETIENDVVYARERPGCVWNIYHPYDKEMDSACLKSVDISMSANLRAGVFALVDYKPMPPEQTVVYDQHEILTGSGTWIVPEGVTEIRAVLIGSGQNGKRGANGSDKSTNIASYIVEDSKSINVFPTSTTTLSVTAGAKTIAAGTGGAGGAAGSPGKVYEITLQVQSGDSFAYTCGEGGTADGVETVFGEHSSADGSTLPLGYTDLITGIAYALPGEDGTAGGDGGSAGQRGGTGGSGASGGSGISAKSQTLSTNTANTTSAHSTIRVTNQGSASFPGAGGGGGGGGSGDSPGSAGSAASQPSTYVSRSSQVYLNYMNNTYGSLGGKGGNGAAGAAGPTYGSAGNGGGGGGGGGEGGSAGITGTMTVTITNTSSTTSSTYNTFKLQATSGMQATAKCGEPGTGGAGGAGAEGCVILYYGEPKTLTSELFSTKDGAKFLDRLSRYVIA